MEQEASFDIKFLPIGNCLTCRFPLSYFIIYFSKHEIKYSSINSVAVDLMESFLVQQCN